MILDRHAIRQQDILDLAVLPGSIELDRQPINRAGCEFSLDALVARWQVADQLGEADLHKGLIVVILVVERGQIEFRARTQLGLQADFIGIELFRAVGNVVERIDDRLPKKWRAGGEGKAS